MHYADWIGPSSGLIKVRLRTSASLRRGAPRTGTGRVPAPDLAPDLALDLAPDPDPEVAFHLPLITEDLLLHATSRLHAILCHAIVHPPGGTHHKTRAHRHVITGRKACQLSRNWGNFL